MGNANHLLSPMPDPITPEQAAPADELDFTDEVTCCGPHDSDKCQGCSSANGCRFAPGAGPDPLFSYL